MDPTFIDQAAFNVAGMVARAAPGCHDYASLWRAFDAASAPVRAVATDRRGYGAHFPCPDPEQVDYLAGMAVPAGAAFPGLETRVVPAGRCAVFVCTLPTIGATYQHIYGDWQVPDGWQIDPTRPDLEIYSGGEGHGAVEIRIPLRAVPR